MNMLKSISIVLLLGFALACDAQSKKDSGSLEYSTKDSLKNNRFGVALGLSVHILSGFHAKVSYTNGIIIPVNKYPYHSQYENTDAESFPNAFGFVHRTLPVIEFNMLTNNNSRFAFGTGYRYSEKAISDGSLSGSIQHNNYTVYFKYDRPMAKEPEKKRKFFYAGAKVSGYYKQLNYGWESTSVTLRLEDMSYQEYSYLGLLQFSPGYRSLSKNVYFDIGATINLLAFASGSYHTIYYVTDFSQVLTDVNFKGDYSKTFFMKTDLILNDITITVGYLF